MSVIQDVHFAGQAGQQLAGKLHLPQGSYRGAAIFAHCFTCSKETLAATRIAAGLAEAGVAVLRFDFTGLGRSQGTFSDTSFASNLEDLKAAASFMQGYKFGATALLPQVLIGHSLGGAAVLSVAPEIASVSAVATIGAPSFAADVIASWAQRCLPKAKKLASAKEGEVRVSASPDGDFAHDIAAGSYLMRADEPASVPGGLDSGPPPYDFLLAGLGACTAMTLRLYARQKGWPLEDVDLQLRHKKDYLEDNKQAGKLDFIDRTITLTGPLDAEMRTRLLQIADKCPVHKSLEAGIKISTSLSKIFGISQTQSCIWQ